MKPLDPLRPLKPLLQTSGSAEMPIKRESGENPEQARYCKFHFLRFIKKPLARDAGKVEARGNKSGDLPLSPRHYQKPRGPG